MHDQAIESRLIQAGQKCFTCHSIRFVMQSELIDGVFHWLIYFHISDPRPAALNLLVDVRSADALQFETHIDCSGGEFGLRQISWTVPEEDRDEGHRCLIYGDVKYLRSNVTQYSRSEPPKGIPVQPMDRRSLDFLADGFSPDSFFGLSLSASLGQVAALDVDFSQGTSELLVPNKSQEQKLPFWAQALLLGTIISIPVFTLLWFVVWN